METSHTVVFTQRAFNAIVTETINKHPLETGGVLLGYVMDNGTWIVVENIPPGIDSTHRSAYFEYDADFVTYVANVVANQYKGNLSILGLWHRHPGSMDFFSSTDDETNRNYARDSRYGSISALVNCDPRWRLTMYHVGQNGEYERAEWFVDEGDLIPPELLELRFAKPNDVPVFDGDRLAVPASAPTERQDGEKNSEEPGEAAVSAAEAGRAAEPGGAAAPSVQDEPYTWGMAFRDMKIIFEKLSKSRKNGIQ